MGRTIRIGIIGDFDANKESHTAINESISHSAEALQAEVKATWVPTPTLAGGRSAGRLAGYDALWASSGSPYVSADGALEGIRYAREHGIPFIGT